MPDCVRGDLVGFMGRLPVRADLSDWGQQGCPAPQDEEGTSRLPEQTTGRNQLFEEDK